MIFFTFVSRRIEYTSCFISKSSTIMAATDNEPKLGGYDYEFTSDVPEEFRCPKCCFPIKDPVQSVQCGHRFCSICVESLLR